MRKAEGRLFVDDAASIKAVECCFGAFRRRAENDNQRARLRGGGGLRDMTDERLAGERRKDLGFARIIAEALSQAGCQNDRGNVGGSRHLGSEGQAEKMALPERRGLRRIAAMISAKIATAISAGLTAPMSRPIGA